MVGDSIANMITAIKNAGAARRESAVIPYSNLAYAIAELLKKEGFVGEVSKKGKKLRREIEVGIIYENREPKVRGVKRISKLSRRVYLKKDELWPVRQGYGMLVLSTMKGICSDREARALKVGGEALFEIW